MQNLILGLLLVSAVTPCLKAEEIFRADSSEILLEIESPIGMLIAYRPDLPSLCRTAPQAKAIFQEAFFTSYTEYHRQSGSIEPVEKWLRLKEGLTLERWLGGVFDEEYQECLAGHKGFIYLLDSDGYLIGWLSHSPVSEQGDLYLSQCSLEASSRNHKVATTAFAEALCHIKELFPEVKEIKLIVRKINTVARRLYSHAGFIMDETIDPSVYGDSYDERYVGYRLPIVLHLKNS